jgi:tetratricopeptide (TPR) repeat protein
MEQLEQIATQIIGTQPNLQDGYLLRAISEMNRKQTAKAETDLAKAMEIAPQSPAAYIQMGNLRQLQKRYGDGEKFYNEALQRNPASGEALSGLMNLYVAQKQVDKALAAAHAQIAKVPDQSVFHDLLATVLMDNKKDGLGAESEFRKAIELDRKNVDAQLKLGQLLVAEGAPERALATYQQALQDNPRDVRFYVLIGQLCESRKDWSNAKTYYQKALEIQPDNPVIANNLAYVLLQEGDNVDQALLMAQRARRGMPDNPSTADTLGWAYYQKGVYGSAIDLFKDALKKSPDNPTYHFHLGLAYQKSDQPGLARDHLQRVLKIKPDYPNADDVKKALAQLQG